MDWEDLSQVPIQALSHPGSVDQPIPLPQRTVAREIKLEDTDRNACLKIIEGKYKTMCAASI